MFEKLWILKVVGRSDKQRKDLTAETQRKPVVKSCSHAGMWEQDLNRKLVCVFLCASAVKSFDCFHFLSPWMECMLKIARSDFSAFKLKTYQAAHFWHYVSSSSLSIHRPPRD